MLPLEKIAFRNFVDALPGSIGWSLDHPGQTIFTGEIGDKSCVASLDREQPWSGLSSDASASGLFVENIEFRVDHTIFNRLDFQRPKIGSLVLHMGQIFICVGLYPSPHTNLMRVGNVGGEGSKIASTFPRWEAITYVDDKPVVLFSRS